MSLIDFSKYTEFAKSVTTQPAAPVVRTKTFTNLPSSIQPIPQQQDQAGNPVVNTPAPVNDNKSITQRIFDLLNVPSQFTEKLLTGGKTYEENLAKQGISPTGQKVYGTVGRLLLDPINLIPVGKIGKVAEFLGKVPGVAKVGEGVAKVGEIAGKGADVVEKIPVHKLVKEGRTLTVGKTTIGGIKENLGQKFIKGYGLPEEYNFAKDEMPTKMGLGTKDIVERTKAQFDQFDKFIKEEVIPKFLEPNVKILADGTKIPGAGTGVDFAALKKEIADKYGATFFEDKIRPVLHEVSNQFRADVQDLVQRGRMPGETAKTLLSQGGYYPRTDFATPELKSFFRAPKIGERRGYTKARKGAEGFTYNAPKAIAQRELAQFQDNVVQDFLKEVKAKFGIAIGGKPIPEGFTALKGTDKRLKELQGYALPQKIAQDLDATFTSTAVLKEMGGMPAFVGNLIDGIDTFNALWKPTATAMNPAFHIQNVIGNLYNSWLGGMKDPRRFYQGIVGGFSPEEKAILDHAGVLARGEYGADVINKTFGNPQGRNILSAFDKFRQAGEYFENNARSAFFLDQRAKLLKQGLSDLEATRGAVNNVNKYLFDYLTGLTPFESNVMRRYFPFYTWARFNIPLQMKSLIYSPEKVAFVAKLQKNINDWTGGIPQGDQEGITFPTPFVDSNGNPVRWRPNLPVQDLFNLNLQRIGSMMNPLIKEGANIGGYALTNEPTLTDQYTGSEITNKSYPIVEQARDIIKSRVSSTFRPLRTFQKMGEEDFSPQGVARQILGGTYTFNPNTVIQKMIYKKNLDNNNIYNKIQKIIRDKTLTKEEKNAEIDKWRGYLQ